MTDLFDDCTVSVNGGPSHPVNSDEGREAIRGAVRRTLKETPEDRQTRERVEAGVAEELRAFIERYEALDAQRADLAGELKEVMAEAKGRGYDTKALRKIIALRKRDADEVAEEEAILALYKSALGMA